MRVNPGGLAFEGEGHSWGRGAGGLCLGKALTKPRVGAGPAAGANLGRPACAETDAVQLESTQLPGLLS